MKLQDYRLSSQIMMLNILMMTIILGALLSSITLFINSMQRMMQTSSLKIFECETYNQLQIFIEDQNRLALQIFKGFYQQETKLNQVFRIIEQRKLITNQPAYDCLMNNNNSNYDSFSYKASFCYLYHNAMPLDNQSYALDLNLSSILTQVYMIFDFSTAYIAYADIRSDYQYYTLFPGDNLSGFQTHLRPWFLNHLANMADHQSVIGYPYQGYAGNIYIAQTVNMTFLNGSLAGIISQDYNFADFPKIQDPCINFVIVNQTGHVIMSTYQLEKNSIILLYDQSQTGFNYEQWIQIQNYSLTNRTFLTFNTLLNRQVYIMTRQWIYPNFIFIIYKDDSEYQNEHTIIDKYFENTIQNIIVQITLILCLSCICLLSIQIILIYFILQKLSFITRTITQKVKLHRYISDRVIIERIFLNQKCSLNNTLDFLLQSYLRITANISQWHTVNPIVQQMNKIRYPQTNYHYKQLATFFHFYFTNINQLNHQEDTLGQTNSFSFANSLNNSWSMDFVQ